MSLRDQKHMPNEAGEATQLRSMPRRTIVLAFIGCLLAVSAFQYLAIVLSLSDFHPGGDVPPDPALTRRAQLGVAMQQPFQVPLRWMQSVTVWLTGGYEFVSSSAYSVLYRCVHWLLLPLIYGSILFFIIRLFFRFFCSPARHASS